MSDGSGRLIVRSLLLLLLCGLAPLTPGCRTLEDAGKPDLVLERFLDRQERRAALLRVLESSGTIEIRQDRDGERSFDDCALELWRDGDRFALRLRKLGERFLWVGSDGDQWWLFELAADPVKLSVLDSGSTPERTLAPDLLLFGPDQLLMLAGIQSIDADPASIKLEDEAGRTLITVPCPGTAGDWTAMTWLVDPVTLLPSRIQILGRDGNLLLEALLGGYEPIRARDQPVGNWPDFPRKLQVRDADGTIDLRFYFNQPGATGDRNRDRLFDLEALMKSFRPGSVEYVR